MKTKYLEGIFLIKMPIRALTKSVSLCAGSGRDLGHASLPRMREAQLIRTYRPNPRYLPHHMRRQRQTGGPGGPGEQENEMGGLIEGEELSGLTGTGERLFFSRTPRTVRRSEDIHDNMRYRRVL